MNKETNYQVAVEKTLIRDQYGKLMFNEEIIKQKFKKIKMYLIQQLVNLRTSEFIDHLEMYTEIGYDDFDNYDEYACLFIKGIVQDIIEQEIEDTQYSDETIEKWEKTNS
jgi:hypothetical protein